MGLFWVCKPACHAELVSASHMHGFNKMVKPSDEIPK